eukprot:NODE_4563_length_1875_cov_21.527460.p1 GENE.NODE_4563_length_1875_cov_21.527460~~NODE_4563_length_1875_cov_21.527460.p1  ORF type:complete len:434 (-),score=95.25 NODE_4563_length_1875_cov_21.527460:454-1755(-)
MIHAGVSALEGTSGLRAVMGAARASQRLLRRTRSLPGAFSGHFAGVGGLLNLLGQAAGIACPALAFAARVPHAGVVTVQRVTMHGFRTAAVLLAATLIYALLPIWGAEFSEPLDFLPHDQHAAVAAHLDIPLKWAASYAPNTVVNVDLEVVLPRSTANIEALWLGGRVDVELGSLHVSRSLVPPHYLPKLARQVRELLWAVPLALGLALDEHRVALLLAQSAVPSDLAGPAAVRIAPAVAVQSARLRLTPRMAGPVGGMLTYPVIFIPTCAAALLSILGFCGAKRDPHSEAEKKLRATTGLGVVEHAMLAKAIAAPSSEPHLEAIVAALEAEDRRAHGGARHYSIPLAALPAAVARARVALLPFFDEQQLSDIVMATQRLPLDIGGLVLPNGELRCHEWTAALTVLFLCGGSDIQVFATYFAACQGKPPGKLA